MFIPALSDSQKSKVIMAYLLEIKNIKFNVMNKELAYEPPIIAKCKQQKQYQRKVQFII
jgi:hypothetical protein